MQPRVACQTENSMGRMPSPMSSARSKGEQMKRSPRRLRLNYAGLRPVLGFVALLGALALTQGNATAAAITSTWTDGDGSWSNPANWDNGVPNNDAVNTFTAVIDNGATVTLDITAGMTSLFNAEPTASTLVLGSGNTLVVSDTVVNDSVIAVNGPGGAGLQVSGTFINEASLRASGGGTLNLLGTASISNSSSGVIQALTGSVVSLQNGGVVGGTLTTAGTGVIEASTGTSLQDLTNSGYFRLNGSTTLLAGTVTNTGTFAVDQPGSGALQWSGTTTLANTGTLLASGGGQFNLLGGTVDNTGGTIKALNGSVIDLQSGTIIGGTLTTAGTGVIEASIAVGLQDVTNAGFFRLGSTSLVSGTVTNTGTFAADQPGFGALQLVGGGATLINQGTLLATGGATLFTIGTGTVTNTGAFQVDANSMLGCFLPVSECPTLSNFNAATGTLTGGTYRVTGTLNFVGANIVTNAATIVFDTSGSKVTDESNLDAFRNFAANTGSFTLQGGRNLATPGSFTNSGAMTIASGSTFGAVGPTYVQTAGTTDVNGVLSAGSLVDIRGGTLSGTGFVGPNVKNGGTVAPGNSPMTGVLFVGGVYTQISGGTLDIEIGGLTAGTDYDVLRVFGNAVLAGALDIDLINGFDPTTDAFFDILLTGLFLPGSVSGTFATLDLPTSSIGTWNVEYLSDRVRIDFAVGGTGTVPEPSTIALMIAALGILAIIQRQRRSKAPQTS
jgi:hypothetical protein